MSLSNCALWFDMGLGKTLLAIAHSLRMYYATEAKKRLFLIICPQTIFGTWQNEIVKHVAASLPVQTKFVHGVKKTEALAQINASLSSELPTFIFTSYETLEKVREGLQELDIGIIFFDEVSKIKNMDASRTRSAHALVRSLPRVPRYLFSGTPSTTAVSGYYSLYELLWPGASGTRNIYSFKHQYENSSRFHVVEHNGVKSHVFAETALRWLGNNYPTGSSQSYLDLGYSLSEFPENDRQLKISHSYNKITGVKNIDKLQQVVDTWSYCLKKTDVLELPPKTLQRREIAMTSEQAAAYEDMLTTHTAEIEQTKFSFTRLSSPFAKLHQIANGFILDYEGEPTYFKDQPKVAELLHTIEESGDQKIVVWAALRPQLALIAETLRRKEIGFVELHGGTKQKDRAGIETKFTKDPDCKVFLSNASVGGIGLNLQCAYLEIFMSNWYQGDVRAQAEDRCWRDGQKHTVSILDFITRNTLELKILNSLVQNIAIENTIISARELSGEAA